MNKKDLKAVLLASALGGAAFVAPVMAEENSQDPVDVNDQTTQTVPADESTVNDQTTNTESAETNAVKDGWSDDGHYYENGEMVVSQFKTIDGKTYYFQGDGSLCRDGVYWLDSDLYYFDVNGVMQTDFAYSQKYFGADGKAVKNQWVQFGDKWRYYDDGGNYLSGDYNYINGQKYAFDDDGYSLSGWQESYGDWYYLSDKGMYLSDQWVDGGQYYVGSDGRMLTNTWIDDSNYVGADGKKTVNAWEQVNGKWKYKLGDGTYVTNRLILDQGKYYAVDSDGYMVVDNTVYVSNYYAVGDGVYGTVRAGKDGVLVKGWYTDSSKTTYYFGDNYFAYGTGLFTIEGKQYYFQYERLVKSRNFVSDGKVYIADANGVVTLTDTTGQTKWVQLNGAWYYLKDGVALTNTLEEIDGSYYYFNDEGLMLSCQTFEYDNHKYYADSNGVVAMKKNTWVQTDNGQTIYYKEDGGLVYDTTFTIDNKLYKFSYDGYLERGTVSVYDRDGTKYYLTDESGVINQTAGWKEYRFHWYYAKEGGVLYTDELTSIDGKSYYFNYSGQMVVNTAQYVGNGLCYFDTNGELVDTVSDFTGTKEFHGLTYLNKDGDLHYTGEYGGRYFSNGILAKDCIVDGKYYVDFDGKILKGWIKTDYCYYYADPTTGILAQDQWLQINGTSYYFISFRMATGYVNTKDGMYQFADDGTMIGKVQSGTWFKNPDTNTWQYVNADGTINQKSKLEINGTTYYFIGNGMGAAYGWFELAENCAWYDYETNTWYWTNAKGTGFDTIDGWKKTSDGYFGYVENGKLVTGVKTINGKQYYFYDSGYLASGVTNYKGKAYVIDENGNSVDYQEGWNTLGDESFYIKNGVALMDTMVDGYYINNEGLTHTGIFYGSGTSDVILVHGKLAKNQWVQSNYSTCYADEKGHMLRNQWIGNRYVDSYGKLVTSRWIGDRYVDANGEWKPNGSTSQETKAGWIQTNGKWLYQHKDGTYTKNDFETIEGQTYYFDENGYMVTGWQKINNKDYFFNASGFMVKDTWQGAYYLGKDGVMLTKAFTPDGYYVGSDGVYVRNQKVTVDGKDYYLNADGKVAKNQWAGDYYLNGNGNVVKNDWVGNYWCGEDGKYVKSSWVDNNKSYVNENGVYLTNQWIGDYYVNGSGVKVTNAWVGSYWCGEDGKYVKSSWVDNNKSYVNENGVYLTNQWIGDYYVNGSGVKVTNAWVGSYWCGSDGKYVKSSWVDNNRYYVNENGVYVAGRWVQFGSRWCYYAGNVYAKDITLNIGGKAYTFDSEGYMVE
ncbi:hypothetical protein [uncultured Holdemanella sp.]|uniref:hypothetical protein n=1 Tax=uncultured Holdemanella sp. TaxID=1763549 RepID=UPI0025D9B216|nr:hypothetical protein [uncultured Holdemanella sp.]